MNDFSYTYHGKDLPAVKNISFTLDEGEFLLICGSSGSGKSTLLSCMKGLEDRGTSKGEILFLKENIKSCASSARDIGYASQFPEEQTVTDIVWHELAFGAENTGIKQSEIRSRIAEAALFFGIEDLLYRKTDELSGGQKQILSLASLLVLRPRVLILDEPLSQLDPIAAEELTALIGRVNRELGIAVVVAEHRLPGLMSLSDKMFVLDGGVIAAKGVPSDIPKILHEKAHPMLCSMPCTARAAAAADAGEYPLTVKDGKAWYKKYAAEHSLTLPATAAPKSPCEPLCSLKDIYFGYDKTDVLKGLCLDIFKGELLTVSGGNAAGKTTLLSLICGNLKPISGGIRFFEKPRFGLFPQEPSLIFSAESVLEELENTGADEQKISQIIKLCRLGSVLRSHPFDLSGGERQRAALAVLFAKGCDVLLLDEPTKGLDSEYKLLLSDILKRFCLGGGSVVLVSHDVDFCAENADRCALLFGGEITCCCTPEEFFTSNLFYTTDAAKTAQGTADGIFTSEQLIGSVGGNISRKETIPNGLFDFQTAPEPPETAPPKKKPLFRKICTALGGLSAAAVMVLNSGLFPIKIPEEPFFLPYLPLILPVILLLIGIAPKNDLSPPVRKKPRQTAQVVTLLVTAAVVVLTAAILMPLATGRLYYAVALLILVECLIPFFIFLEKKKPSAKDIAAMAVMCAAAIAGRGLFFMLPQFKPTAALVIITAAVFGAQPGFIVGAATMLASNMMFGQGPWTVWQMLAMGLTAFFAGLLFYNRRSKTAMCIYGFFSVLIIYGGIMNISGYLTAQPVFDAGTFFAYIATALPFDIIHATAAAVFILLLSGELVKRLDRIKEKYGLFV